LEKALTSAQTEAWHRVWAAEMSSPGKGVLGSKSC
jgi:hypothetical protein